jgi:multiple sugar transport system substrate-binding protein
VRTTATAAATTSADCKIFITLWTYPIGKWGDEASVKKLTDAFTADTGISVTVEYLTYKDGDDKVNTALSAGQSSGSDHGRSRTSGCQLGHKGLHGRPLRRHGFQVTSEIYSSVLSACKDSSGKVYEYPLVMTAHCMAVNVDAFKEAGADKYLDLTTHTWTTENFEKAMAALSAKFGDTVGAVYCAGQGGDQGTRALVNNLYGGTFTNAAHTGYTWDR